MELLRKIAKSKNFYRADIEMSDLMDSIDNTEFRNMEEKIEKHTKEFFKKDEGEVMGYYVCKGFDTHKFYLVLVNKKLFMAPDTFAPYFWYPIESEEDFKQVKRAYNSEGDKFPNKLVLVSLGINGDDKVKSLMSLIHSDYEYVTVLHHLCMNNNYINGEVFGYGELYDKKIEDAREKYTALENSLLTKRIMDVEKGFYVRGMLSNSIISIKCSRGMVFINCLYNNFPKTMGGITLPIDFFSLVSNFNVRTLDAIVNSKSEELLRAVKSVLPVTYFGDLYYQTHRALSEENDHDDKYKKVLTNIFTDLTIHRIFLKWGKETERISDLPNQSIIELVKDELSEEEKKYISHEKLDNTIFRKDPDESTKPKDKKDKKEKSKKLKATKNEKKDTSDKSTHSDKSSRKSKKSSHSKKEKHSHSQQ